MTLRGASRLPDGRDNPRGMAEVGVPMSRRCIVARPTPLEVK